MRTQARDEQQESKSSSKRQCIFFGTLGAALHETLHKKNFQASALQTFVSYVALTALQKQCIFLLMFSSPIFR